MSNGKFEVGPVSNYPHILAYIPGVRLEYELQPEHGAVQKEPVPSMSYLVVAARTNAGLAPTTILS